jgi:hypothetical protein
LSSLMGVVFVMYSSYQRCVPNGTEDEHSPNL